jgi:hypothetical protein
MTSGAKAITGAKSGGSSTVTLAGDVTGVSNANTVAKINGSPLGTTTGATTGYVLTWNGTAWAPAAVGGSGVTSFNTRTGAVVPANADYLAVATGGLTGATSATRFVGGTANGAPTSGSFQVGDFIVDETASIWICVVAGTPGTWATSISNHVTLRSATATAKYNEITLFTGSTAGQTISAAASPLDSTTWTIINNSTVTVTAGFASNAMYPLGSASTVTSLTVPINGAYSFVNYNGGNWYMVASNNAANIQGTLAVANGGTGTSTAPATGGIPYATSSTAYAPLAIGTAGQVLTVNGGATAPTWATPAAGALTYSNQALASSITLTSATDTYTVLSYSAAAGTYYLSSSMLVSSTQTGTNQFQGIFYAGAVGGTLIAQSTTFITQSQNITIVTQGIYTASSSTTFYLACYTSNYTGAILSSNKSTTFSVIKIA